MVAERHPDLQHLNPDVLGIYRLFAPLSVDGQLYRVKLTVKAYASGRRVLHALEGVEIENAPLGTFPAYSGAEALRPGQPTTGRTVSIEDLLRGATRHDGQPFRP